LQAATAPLEVVEAKEETSICLGVAGIRKVL
jgi:hypothetical protein